MPRRRFIAGATVASATALLLALALWPAHVPRIGGPLRHEAYVWQRQWGGAVRAAVAADLGMASLCVLHTEVSFGPWEVARAEVDFDALRAAGRPVGLALRIGPFRGPLGAGDDVVRLARAVVDDARRHGVEPAELQIDFDAAESQLDGYRVWVEGIRAAVAPTPVVITALPSWLGRWAFGRLARASDGFVLQVHSLERPATFDAPATLCDPRKAQAWVDDAARVGVPFRVALPTYGYRLTFEDRTRLLEADPDVMASLVRAWTADRPMMMGGVIWFRLPVEAEALNWSAPTLAAVMAGRSPRSGVTVRVRSPEPGLVEVDVVNEGERDDPPPAGVKLRWSSKPLAADAMGGYLFADPSVLQWTGGAEVRLRPGTSRTVAWLRFTKDTEVHAHVITDP